MPIAKSIAQAKTYSQAYTFLSLQMLALTAVAAIVGPHLLLCVLVPIVFVLMSMFKWTRVLLLVALSGAWAFVVYRLFNEGGSGLYSYVASLISFLVIYSVNAVGMVGLNHAVPDFKY